MFWSTSGKNPTDQYLDGMMLEAPGPINFTMFLTMFGEKLNGTDPEDVIKNAFGCFDEDNSGSKLFKVFTNPTPSAAAELILLTASCCLE